MNTLVTITHDMPLPEQLRLWTAGREANAVIVYTFDADEAEALEDYAANHGDPTYADRMADQMNDAMYMRQSDRFTYRENGQ